MKILHEHGHRTSGALAQWILSHCPYLELDSPYSALGWGDERRIVAGVLYDNFTRVAIDVHVAAVGKPWLPGFLRETFRYPFLQLGVRRLTAKVPALNLPSRRFVEALGFVLEGTVRKVLRDGNDCCIYGLLRSECRWLETPRRG